MDLIKEAFKKIKEDIISINTQLNFFKSEIESIKKLLSFKNHQEYQNNTFKKEMFENNQQYINQKLKPTIPTKNLLDSLVFSFIQSDRQTDNSKNNHFKDFYSQNNQFSMGNEGVQTNRQTDKQTNRQTFLTDISSSQHQVSDFEKANKILSSLDNIKKEIRLKFKNLTSQEMLVFTTLYGFDKQNIDEIDYSLLSKSLSLTESSIRDYINKLIKKGIPIDKIRKNNKKILLKISSDLKKIASLSTIIKLRDL